MIHEVLAVEPPIHSPLHPVLHRKGRMEKAVVFPRNRFRLVLRSDLPPMCGVDRPPEHGPSLFWPYLQAELWEGGVATRLHVAEVHEESAVAHAAGPLCMLRHVI